MNSTESNPCHMDVRGDPFKEERFSQRTARDIYELAVENWEARSITLDLNKIPSFWMRTASASSVWIALTLCSSLRVRFYRKRIARRNGETECDARVQVRRPTARTGSRLSVALVCATVVLLEIRQVVARHRVYGERPRWLLGGVRLSHAGLSTSRTRVSIEQTGEPSSVSSVCSIRFPAGLTHGLLE